MKIKELLNTFGEYVEVACTRDNVAGTFTVGKRFIEELDDNSIVFTFVKTPSLDWFSNQQILEQIKNYQSYQKNHRFTIEMKDLQIQSKVIHLSGCIITNLVKDEDNALDTHRMKLQIYFELVDSFSLQ